MVRPNHQQPMNNHISNHINNQVTTSQKPLNHWALMMVRTDQQPDQNQAKA